VRIFTLWEHDGDNTILPWLVAATDEWSIAENNGYPDAYAKALKDGGVRVRELVIVVPDAAVEKLFRSPKVEGKVEEQDDS
jgi:hypothetical protein